MPLPNSNLNADAWSLMRDAGSVAAGVLREPPGSARDANLARKLAGLLELKMAAHATPDVDCRPGCDSCCHRVISAIATEVGAVAAHVAESFSPDQRAALVDRLRRYLVEVGPSQGRELFRLRPACPFLVDGQCSVYEVRPLSCQAQFSTDVSACRAARFDSQVPFPETREAVFDRAATLGLLTALRSAGQFANPLDFGRAVYMLLERGGLGLEFAAPAPDPPLNPGKVGTGNYPTYRPGEEPIGVIDMADLTEARHFLFAEGDVERAFAVAPDTHSAHRLFRRLSPPVIMRVEEIEEGRARFRDAFHDFVEMEADPRQKFDAIQEFPTLRLSYLQGDDRQILSEIGDYETNELTAKLLSDLCEPIGGARKGGKLRVGYIGNQLDTSSSGLWPTGWLAHHGPDFETFVFDLSRGERPGTDLYRSLAHHFFRLPGPVPETARFIKSHDLDVLIYPDLASRGRPIQFATMRLARLQCAGWGGPGTTGMPNIDVFLSGDYMEPANGADHYRERLVRLPRTGLCYPRPSSELLPFSKLDFGLDEGRLILCAQTPSKLLPQWDYVFREICERSGRPIVFFRYPQWPHWALERRLNEAGVRTIFMPVFAPENFRALLRLADVALDAIGWSGGITAIETIGAGLPTVTLPGEFRRSRHTAAFLTAANAPGLIASGVEDYVDLATNPDRRAAAARDLTPPDLFDDRAAVAALDQFLLGTV